MVQNKIRLKVLSRAFFLPFVGPIIFWISWPSNLVAKNAVVFSGSIIDTSVSMVSVFAVSIVCFFDKYNKRYYFYILKVFLIWNFLLKS